jgi:hypothetical protein
MSERFIFHKTTSGVQLHDGDKAMTELEAEKILNDLWNTCKEQADRLKELLAKVKILEGKADAEPFLVTKRDLEMQAKGIEDFIEPMANRSVHDEIVYDLGLGHAFNLRKQASEL